jgi:hypothetical protein
MYIRRMLAVAALLALAIIISSSLHGQQKSGNAKITPQIKFAPSATASTEPTMLRFQAPGVETYAPLNGDRYFALQLAPKLDAAPRKPRDFLIMMSTSGAPDCRRNHGVRA